jgi:FKBP-type peptidyl-prolyl cis-trans isomerase FkpA
MKKGIVGSWLLLLFVSALSGCVKNNEGCESVRPDTEEPLMLSYMNTNHINGTKHSSGMYYEIGNPGSGVSPSSNSRIIVTYTGKLLNGTIFERVDTPDPNGFILNQVIEGWKIGLPLIKEGGSIKLIIPSSLAYSCIERPGIPANSVLVFEINLIDVL